jgi:hypothetical protein
VDEPENPQPDGEAGNSESTTPFSKLLDQLMVQQSRAEQVQDRLLTEKDRLINRLSWFLLVTSFLGQGNLIATDFAQKLDQLEEAFTKIERMRR